MTHAPLPSSPRRLPLLQPSTAQADFQNDAIAGSKVLSHEDAAHEKRNWVRLSYDCNNHCTFCLDSNAHDGTMRDNNEIKVQIIEGRKKGAERLILSGGEPTMHPNFLDFVLLGRKAGYRKVQTVTNGRMFKYPAFLETAAKNGLNEITFSLHGHTAKLHDALVGTPGAFADETAGLKAALAAGVFIINIDIVINKQNIKHLPTMLETFIGWGVKEFDLLHIIPFGNAWTDARDHLFYDLDGNLEHLQKAFAYARREDVHIWLNRFPPPYAEGFEDLIQDPYKLNDEVRGRREEYDRYLTRGQKLDCREPARCKHCYLQSLCDNLDEVLAVRKLPAVDVHRLEAPRDLEHGAGAAQAAGRLSTASRARLVAADLPTGARLAAVATPPAIELDLTRYDGLADALGPNDEIFGKRLLRAYAATPEAMATLLAVPGSFEIAVYLAKETEAAVRALGDARTAPRLVLVQRNYDRVSDAHAHDIDTKGFLASSSHGVALENIPACLGGRRPRPAPTTLDVAMLGPDGRVDMTAYTKRYVTDGYYTKALRCKDCSENAMCRGVHVNWVRAHGFAALAPLTAPLGRTEAPPHDGRARWPASLPNTGPRDVLAGRVRHLSCRCSACRDGR